jgi:hypothetical protein
MPAKSPEQQRFMGMCSTPEGRKKAKGKCPPQSVAKEFAHKPSGGYSHDTSKPHEVRHKW